MSLANFIMVLESCVAKQSWVNRENRKGLSTHSCGAPCVEGQIGRGDAAYPHHLGSALQEVQDAVAGSQTW